MRRVPYHACQPIIISGPSGVGKGTLTTKLRETHPEKFATVVSHTTRPPRPGEVEGIHYYFTNISDFQALYAQGMFIECTFYNGHHYGTSLQAIQNVIDRGMTPLLDIDMEGVKTMKAFKKQSVKYVFIKPPSLETLEARLRGRETEDEESIKGRLAQAALELDYAARPGIYDLTIINNDLETAYQTLEKLALSTEPLPPKEKSLRGKVETLFEEIKLRWVH
ncbi:P-loop containing nucleoside triphosphate hydrolase protein [Fusarium flagelliforme]|uniref:P-loop containing nucleoside triphosphate hydrolase protein n=1 Tax=Fusarium flagelliforme TaxID=2675880 RepID=UPI001E8EA581|nr:P-loop containing nucleoside triphosphate hydrolase protein [Fusarium flagelliforme]KAH7183312.1 P-loop containing nucleoside triphosphate hydrolase protein [Fusarium flagelliforme]